MYSKRVLILQQTNKRFAERGKELCGLVKLVNNSADTTDVTVFVTNADTAALGEWWIALSFNRECFARQLSTLNNCVFALPQQSFDNVSALLIKREDKCYEVARAHLGSDSCDAISRQMEFLLRDNDSRVQDDPTPYEKFVASTSDYYNGLDVAKLKLNADARYKSVSEYSNAFERYYASGGGAEYYDSVKSEIGKVFVQFPPYYPLIQRYKGSFFVRIDFPSSDKYFVLGVLEKRGQIRYICYGLPAEKEGFADKDFVYVEDSPVSFWMLFQDASTGQISSLNELL